MKKMVQLCLVMLALCAVYIAPTPAYAQNTIEAVSINGVADGKLQLTVRLRTPISELPHDFAISNPPRIAFDFPDTDVGLEKSAQDFNQGGLRSINVVKAGGRARLVVNLNQVMNYETKVEGNSFVIALENISKQETKSRFAEEGAQAQARGLQSIDFRRGANGSARVEVMLSNPSTGIDIRQQGKNIVIDFANSSVPQSLQRKLDVTDFGTPVNSIDTFSQGNNVRMVIEPQGLWEHSAYQADNKFVLEVKRKLVEEAKKRDDKPVYTGDKLTLNFQSIQTREALNVIADFTGLNIVISDTVTGNVTLRLKDVPWDQALDIILQSKGLDMRKNGNVIQIAPREEIAARDKVNMTAAQDVADLEPLRTESFVLSYQKGTDIVTLISNKEQRILSKRGSAVVDARTNTLFVQDTSARLEDVRRLIQQIDVPVRQVMIEARFVSAATNFNRNLGGKIMYQGLKAPAPGFNLPGGQVGGAVGVGGVALPVQNTAVPSALTLQMFNPAYTKVLSLELDAAEVEGTTKNIASPRVVTADKTAATISSGTQIPYQTTSASGTNVQFKDATLSLTVTPQITPDDHVDMRLTVTQDTVGAIIGTGGAPTINTKKVNTQVLVENGGTVVIGGVYTQDFSEGTQKVPLFGDIPFIGWLFKNKTKVDNKNELLVFITPKILKESIGME